MDRDDEGPDDLEDPSAEEEQGQQAGWKALFNFTTRAHYFPLVIGLLLSVASGVVIPALAYFLGKIFDIFSSYAKGSIDGSDLTSRVSTSAIDLVALGSVSWLLNGGFFMFWLSFGELQAKEVRNKLFDGMLKKDMEWYDMRKAGINAMIPRLQTQIRELQIATSQPLGFAIQHTVTLFAALGLAFYTAWNLTLVTVAAIPVTAVVLAWLSARMQPAIDSQIQALTQASKLLNNSITSIDSVKVFNGQDEDVWKYITAVREAAVYYLKVARGNATQIGIVRVTLLGMFVQGFWYGSHLVDIGNKTSGQILTAFWACLMATQTMEQLLPQMIVLEKGKVAAATLKAVLNKVERGRQVVRMVGQKTPQYCDGDIQIRSVSFAYPSRPDRLALNNTSFFFPAGETTFVIGRSGSGKSTLGNLLMQFYPPASGDIVFDGESIQVLDTNWLRNNVTLVQQASVLFNETIFMNVALGKQDHGRVTIEEVQRCIDAAALTETMRDLPKGLDTLVGKGGSSMSGGQKQRVAIARARFRDTPVLVLDEATSALDHVSRTAVLESIRKWRRGKTTIIITHDISQIEEDDYAYILDRGRIVQEGYRNVIDKMKGSPFDGFVNPGGKAPTSSLKANLQAPQPRLGLISPVEDSPRSSLDSKYSNGPDAYKNSVDSMEVRLPQRASIFYKAFSPIPAPDTNRSHRQSQTFLSSLPPMAMHMNRMSNVRMSMVPMRSYNQQLEPISPRPMSSGFELENLDARLYKPLPDPSQRQAATRRSLHPSTPNLAVETPPPRPKRLSHIKEPIAPTPSESDSEISSLKAILSTVWPNLTWKQRILLIVGFISAFIHAGATPLFAWVFSKLLATFFIPEGRSQEAFVWSMAVLGVAVGDATASYCMHILFEMTGQAWVDSLRIEAMKRILNQPKAWFDRDENNISSLMECLDRNAEEMRNLVGRFAGFLFVAAVMMTISLVWSLIVCWKLTLVGMATAPIMYAITRGFEAMSGTWESKSNEASEGAGSIFHETFVNIRTVRALTLEGYFHEKYARATTQALKVGIRRAAYSGLFFGISDASIVFITALIFYYGSVLASSSAFTTQDILTVFSQLLFGIANVNAIVAYIPQINSSRDTATRLLRLASLPLSTSHEATGTERLTHLPGPLTFHSLTFTYPLRPTYPVLNSFSLAIPLHTSTALVGPSGSGKSTIAALLLRLCPASPAGALTIGPIPLADLHTPTYRTLLGYVPQSPTLFPATIAQNIIYGLPITSPRASPASVAAAADAAGIHTFVASLPLGYDTPVGDGGVGLSGGQVQRLGIARALVRKPQLLIMDEPTSGLDSESAEGIRQVLGVLVQEGVTLVCVTHSEEMMRACDRVVVMGEGRVVEVGAWGELMGGGGALSRLMGGNGGVASAGPS